MRASDPALVEPVSVELTRPGWIILGSTHAIGQAYWPDGRLLRARDIAQCLDAVGDDYEWSATIGKLNGSFAVVSRPGADLRAAVDRLRSFPLFYTFEGRRLRISDRAASLVSPQARATLDANCKLEFQFTGYVTGEETLVPGLRQIRAGYALMHRRCEKADLTQVSYYEFRHRDFVTTDDDKVALQLAGVHERVFERLLKDVGDRQIVIPLSGGYDSRLIGHSLRELGARNVLCYTYGLRGNWESGISRALAQHLGFDWIMVPYSNRQWRTVGESAAFNRYFMEAGDFASLAHVQDWPAVQALVAQDKLSPDAVFVPGHSGDFLAGSHIPQQYKDRVRISRTELLQSIFDAHYSLWDWPTHAAGEMARIFTNRIERVIGPATDGTAEQAADTFECWDCQERQAKFIVNSVRAYEFFGFEWRLPLFDAELMDFWSRIPLDGRLRRRLYFEFARRYQRLPLVEPNTDRGALLRTAVRLIDASGLRPAAKRARRYLMKSTWRTQYDHGDLGWFALIEPKEFRMRYTGRENGHAFFALKYLEALRDG